MILKFARRLNILRNYCWEFEIFRFGATKAHFCKESIILARFVKKSGQHGTLKCFGLQLFSLLPTTYLRYLLHLLTFPSIDQFIHLKNNLPIHTPNSSILVYSFHPSTHPPTINPHPPIHPFIHPFIHSPPIHSSIILSIPNLHPHPQG